MEYIEILKLRLLSDSFSSRFTTFFLLWVWMTKTHRISTNKFPQKESVPTNFQKHPKNIWTIDESMNQNQWINMKLYHPGTIDNKTSILATPEVVQLLMGAWVLWEHQEVGNHIFFQKRLLQAGEPRKQMKISINFVKKCISTFEFTEFYWDKSEVFMLAVGIFSSFHVCSSQGTLPPVKRFHCASSSEYHHLGRGMCPAKQHRQEIW